MTQDPAPRHRRTRTVEQKRRIREGTQAAMKRRAETRRCWSCSRKNALVRLKNPDGIVAVVVCRYCKVERPGAAFR
jgi:RNase P subunit RPR2